MKCDQLLAYLESGNIFKRNLARRHARGCQECEQAYSIFKNIKKTLSETEPLTTSQKELWMSVVQDSITDSKENHQRTGLKFAGGFALAAGLLIAIFFIQQGPDKKQEDKPIAVNREVELLKEEPITQHDSVVIGVVQISEIEEVTYDVDFSELKEEILEMEQQIDTQFIHALLLDARKDVDILLAENQN